MLKYIPGSFIIFSSIILLYQLAIRHIIYSISELLDVKLKNINPKKMKYQATK